MLLFMLFGFALFMFSFLCSEKKVIKAETYIMLLVAKIKFMIFACAEEWMKRKKGRKVEN